MRSEITADIVEGQIQTAEGLLQWIQAEANMTRRAFSVTQPLLFLAFLLSTIIKTMQKIGVDQFDPEHSGYTASKFIEVSEAIRLAIARSDASGLYNRFPCGRLFEKILAQGKTLADMAGTLQNIDEEWQAMIEMAAQKQISQAKKVALTVPEESIELFDSPRESSDSPSEHATRSQFHRAVNLHAKS